MQTANYRLSMLEMENYRQYKSAKIKFSQDPKKMFTIIMGDNGSGKTNIMNAITWCLYGREKHLSIDDEDLPIVNADALKDKQGSMVHTKVRIVLADANGDKASIQRTLSLYTSDKSEKTIRDREYGIVIPENSTPTVTTLFQTHKEGGWEQTEYFDKSVKDLLPEDLAAYFLFDGEKLENFFDHTEDVERGIKDVSQVQVVSETVKSLSGLVSRLRREVKGVDPKIQELQQKYQETEQSLENTKKQIRTLKKKYGLKKSERDNAEQEVVKVGGNAEQYQKDLINARGEMDLMDEKYNSAKDAVKDIVLDNEFKIKMLPHICKTRNMIKQKIQEGVLPPKIKDTFLKEILDSGRCICGGDISHGTKSREKVRGLMEKAQYSSIEELCVALKYELEPMLNPNSVKEELLKAEKTMHGYSEKSKDLREKCKELNAKIDGVDTAQIQNLQKRKGALQEEMEEIRSKMGECEYMERQLKSSLESLSRDIDRELAKKDKYLKISKKIDLCKKSQEGLKKVSEELLSDVRNEVQTYTKKYFLEFLWKKDTYDDVVISDDYNITARHVEGYNVRGGLAMGEKLVLALSFMSALRKITGFGFPLIIDTPLGRVSGKPRHNIARALPTFLKDTQVTMLVTDAEYNAEIQDDQKGKAFPSVHETLDKRVGCYYHIKYTDGNSKVKGG